MKKLSMKVDELRVETFSIQTEPDTRRGTVRAHAQDSNFCWSEFCGNLGSDGCYESMGCTFTASFDCMESAGCP
jgi:hypothetical protein